MDSQVESLQQSPPAAKGSSITVSCEGDDAEHAMTALAKIIENGFGET